MIINGKPPDLLIGENQQNVVHLYALTLLSHKKE